jgi:16S rRNA (guanine527-N7)-methyltransferase
MDHLVEGSAALGLTLSAAQLNAFDLYYEELMAWNEKFNLTSVTGYEEVQTRHFVDSLSVLQVEAVRHALQMPVTRAIDVGSGAGFPGIPLKIACPAFELTLLEATGKKVSFLAHVVERLRLAGARAVKARAEDLGRDPAHRAQYDVALARAVAGMAVLAEYTLPFLSQGGWLVALKGEDAAAEAQAAGPALESLGGVVREVVPAGLPGLPVEHALVAVQKVASTPEKYPRRPGMPAKRPLGS